MFQPSIGGPRWARVCLLLLAVASLAAAQADVDDRQRLAILQSELRQARQAQDQGRLREVYSEIATLQPRSAEAHRGLGLACYLEGDFEAALSALEKARSLQPDLAGVRLYLGICYYRLNRFAAAQSELELSPELRAGDGTASFWLGASYRALGRLSESIRALESALGRGPSEADVLRLLTRAYSERAAEWFSELLAGAADSAPAGLLRAEELAMDGVLDAALREADAALASMPGLSGPHRLKGEILWQRGERELAVREFRRELLSNPCSAEAHLRIGIQLRAAGQHAEAELHLRNARRYAQTGPGPERPRGARPNSGSPARPGPGSSRQPSSSGSALAAARRAFQRGEAELALGLLDRALAQRPESVAERSLLATCSLAMGDAGRAVEQLREVLSRQASDPAAIYGLGRAHELLAAQAADRLLELDPRSPGVRLLRGEALERGPRYDFEGALAEYRAAESLVPDDPGVQQAMGRVLFKMQRLEDAIPHLEAVLAGNAAHGMANYLLGRILLLQGERGRAIELLAEAVRARPELLDARRDLARALVRDGRLEDGIAVYEALLEESTSDPGLHALLAAAYRRAGRVAEAKEQAERAREASGAGRPSPER